MKRILFITPTFGYTGSEMLLWYSLSHLNQDKFKAYLFSKKNGKLIETLPSHIKSFVPYKIGNNKFNKILRVFLKWLKIDPLRFQLSRIQKTIKADYWYVNTIVNPEVYQIASDLGVKVVTHVHELPLAYGFIAYKEMESLLNYSQLIIGCSKAVCDKIVGMGKTSVHLFYGFVDQAKIRISKNAELLRKELGFEENDYIWAVSGKTTFTKGIDFLIPLLERLPANVKILWIGGEENTGLYYYVKKTIAERFAGKVLFTGEQKDDYYNYLNCSNAFLLLSREDSFPLVMLEAAVLGKPIVGFNSGGIKEFVEEKMGIVVDSWSFDDLVKAMSTVQNYGENFDTNRIKEKATEYDASKQVGRWEEILESI
ncbi:glycosyltransferase [Pedobacter hiemivivus]|uniref:Glycosyltransferase n=1 Tax=Pedobacter hiemivivus TaxID=2530454 RepID=A0A4U1G0L2_9SPHI|nr:glycosyltransferase [Pedobacter hiemivivus]TKC55813.1 glycosyltransferase [Pedobacter hiemivivus]